MTSVIGIDLGTTSSRVAIMHGGSPGIIENSEGEGTTPSFVALKADGSRLVGEAARRYSLGNPESVVFAVKRLIGRKYNDPIVQELKRFMPFHITESASGDAWIRVEDKEYAPEQIAAFILQKMKKTAEDYLGEPVTQAVITVPAYFNDQQRQSTRNAAKIAGLEALRLVAEPTMAALAYGLPQITNTETIAVYDLGGGTFDVSILEIGDGVFEVKSTNGDMFLGGEDFDFRIVDHLAENFRSTYGIDLMSDPVARQRLKQAAETAKIDLSSLETATIDLPFIYSSGKNALHLHTTIGLATFESLIKDLVERSMEVCRRAMTDAERSSDQIERIILVGGSTRIPCVQRELHNLFGKAPYGGLRREDAVALGAAIYAAIMSGTVKNILLLDVTPFSLGIETLGGVFTRLIDRNTNIPTKKSQVFSTAEDSQTAVSIRIYQGDSETTLDNKLLAQFDLVDIPPAPKGVPQIEVTFDIDSNSILQVSAQDKSTKKDRSLRIIPSGGLSEEDVTTMRLDAQSVGISPQNTILPIMMAEPTFRAPREEQVEPAPAIAQRNAHLRAPSSEAIPQIFVSYAHEDEKWAKAIIKSFAVLTHSDRAIVWSDHSIRVGTEWEEKIYKQIEESNVAILLLSNDFLDSSFILAKELPAIFAEKERRHLEIVPIVVRPCAFDLHEKLSKFQLFNKPETPLSSMVDWKVEMELLRLVRVLAKIGP